MPSKCLTLLVLLAALGCGADGIQDGEAPEDYAARLAADHPPSVVADRMRELLEGGTVDPETLESGLSSKCYGLLMEGRIETASVIRRAVTEVFPDSWMAWEGLAEAAVYQGDEELARESLERALALDSVNSEAAWILPVLSRRLLDAAEETPVLAWFRPGEVTGLTGPYLGQTLPGIDPEIFAPGIVSTRGGHEFSITFSPDGRELYFNRGPNIYEAHWGEGGWTAPAPVSFNSDALDHEPHITSDGRRLFFGSARPREVEEGERTYGIWVMERSGDGWGAPTFLFPGMYVTTTTGGDAYLTVAGGIGVYPWRDGAYQPVERVLGGINTLSAVHPCIDPDGSFMVFDSDNDLYISVSDEEGSWSEPLELEELNSQGVEMTASLSPDGRYLFYYSHHDIYWVSTEVLQPYLSALGDLRRRMAPGP